MAIGIFGANGFLGRHLVRSMIKQGLPTICFGRQFPPDFYDFVGTSAEVRVVDIVDELDTLAKLQGVTDVVQLISSSKPGLGNDRAVADIETNLVPHVQFIKSCISSKIRTLTYVSSGGTVYGVPRYVPIDEGHPTEPLNSYGQIKLVTEQYLKLLCRGTDMRYSILRLSNPFGPGQVGLGGQGLIGTVIRQHLAGETVNIFGNGLSERDYLYVDDAIEAIVRTVQHGPIADPINIGSGVGRTVLDVIGAIEQALGMPIPRNHLPDRGTDTPSNVLDVTRARDLLGWEATTQFNAGVAKTLEWFMTRGGPRQD
jgi:UDP-glucose 4-epimerase